MNYLSVCSGIEAATVAWHDIGWTPAGFSEIEPFPSAVLSHHYPNVTNFGDMTKFKEWNLDPDGVDLLVGGTPCQSFSVAGLRKGLDDPRGNLALTYCSMLDHFRPTWFIWENVPGVLSSSGGRDFGSFLGAVAELGYGFAYRVLDAQYFGVAQRRRRVFVVGQLGNWQRAAAVLFERESLCRNTAPSREKREETARIVAPSLTASNDPSRSPQSSEITQQVAAVVSATFDRQSTGEYGTKDIASTVDARDYKSPSDLISYSIQSTMIGRKPENGPQGSRISEEVCFTLTKSDQHGVAHSIDCRGVSPTLTSKMQGSSGWAPYNESEHLVPMAHPIIGGIDNENNAHGPDEVTGPLMKGSPTGGGRPLPAVALANMAVRRLTPVECERLQGFPDGYTNIHWRKSVESPDGPRYKALGNSMAVPVMRWIGERINQVKEIK
jgi:DNA (cytosine-5)-methyltransferase 1